MPRQREIVRDYLTALVRETCKALICLLNLPDGLKGIGSIALGYTAAEPLPPNQRKDNYYRIIK